MNSIVKMALYASSASAVIFLIFLIIYFAYGFSLLLIGGGVFISLIAGTIIGLQVYKIISDEKKK